MERRDWIEYFVLVLLGLVFSLYYTITDLIPTLEELRHDEETRPYIKFFWILIVASLTIQIGFLAYVLRNGVLFDNGAVWSGYRKPYYGPPGA